MPNRIILRRGSGVPNVSNFAIGEPAFSSLDGKFYIVGGSEFNKKVFQVWTDQNDILDTRTSGKFKIGTYSDVDVSIARNNSDYIGLTSLGIVCLKDLIPTGAYSIGSSISPWSNGYFSNSLRVSNTTITSSGIEDTRTTGLPFYIRSITGVDIVVEDYPVVEVRSGQVAFDAHIIPNVNTSYDLGSSTTPWKNAYFGGIVKTYSLAVSSTTRVDNLNADMVDNRHASDLGGLTAAIKSPATAYNILNAVSNVALTTLSATTDLIHFVPFIPWRDMDIYQFAIAYSAASGTNTCYFGIYNDSYDTVNGTHKPGNLIFSGSMTFSAAGALTFSYNGTIPGNTIYWLAVKTTLGTSATYRAVAVGGQHHLLGVNSSFAMISALTYTYTSTGLPTNASGLTFNVATAAAVPAFFAVLSGTNI